MPAAVRPFRLAVLLMGLISAALACGAEPPGSHGQDDAGVRSTGETTGDDVPAGEEAGVAAPDGGSSLDAGAPGCEQARSELCNGLDEDCDGRVDEGFDLDGDGRLSRAAGCGAFYPDADLDCDDRHAELGARCPLFVRAAAIGGNTGVDWDNAFNDLQAALAIARSGDEIRVAEGRYTPDRGTLDRLRSFVVPPGVWLRGSYDGTTYDGAAHDRTLHPTILTGDLLADDALPTGGRKDNSRHVVQVITRPFSTGEIILEGLEIRGGYAENNNIREDGRGAALYGRADQLELRDCLITDSEGFLSVVDFEGGMLLADGLVLVGNRGGLQGRVMVSRASTTILRSEVRDNHTSRGSAIMDLGIFLGMVPQPILIANTRFISNTNDRETGRVLAVHTAGTAQILDCEFIGNRASGGTAHIQASTTEVGGSTFRDNGGPAARGGALALDRRDGFESQVTIEKVHFEGNVAAYGGALHAMGTSITMRATRFVANEGAVAGGAMVMGRGTHAAIFDSEFRGNRAGGLGGAWSITADAQVSCSQCVFNANSARDGQPTPEGLPDDMEASALWIDTRASVHVSNSAFVNHSFTEAAADSDVEGLITVSSGSFSAVNTVFWGNEPAQIAARAGGKEPATATFSYCAADLPLVGTGTRELDASPFVAVLGADGVGGTLDDDLRLRAGSMCIDAGNGAQFGGEAALDFIGQSRFVDDTGTIDVGVGEGPIIDIGPFEYQGI